MSNYLSAQNYASRDHALSDISATSVHENNVVDLGWKEEKRSKSRKGKEKQSEIDPLEKELDDEERRQVAKVRIQSTPDSYFALRDY